MSSVQDVEFTRYDTYTVLHYVVFASLSYVGHEVDRSSPVTLTRGPEFNPRAGNVPFKVGRVALEQVFV
jgi:hypothetical protein